MGWRFFRVFPSASGLPGGWRVAVRDNAGRVVVVGTEARALSPKPVRAEEQSGIILSLDGAAHFFVEASLDPSPDLRRDKRKGKRGEGPFPAPVRHSR